MATGGVPAKASSVMYFYGRITREEAEIILKERGCREGLFLLRESINPLGNYAISICHNNEVYHYSIEKQIDGSFMIPQGQKFTGPIELISHHKNKLDGFVTKPTVECDRLPCQTPVAFRGMTYMDLENELVKKAETIKNADMNKALGSHREHLVTMVSKQLHEKQPWYHGKIGREEAEKRLQKSGHSNGKFIIRLRDDKKTFALSLSHNNQTRHYIVEKQGDGKLAIQDGPKFECVIMLVDHYHNKQDGLLCKLSTPCCCPGYDKKKYQKYLENASDNLAYLTYKDLKGRQASQRNGTPVSPTGPPGRRLSSVNRANIPLPSVPKPDPNEPVHPAPLPPGHHDRHPLEAATNGFENHMGGRPRNGDAMEEIYSQLPRTKDAFELKEKQIEIEDELGSGQFGSVRKGVVNMRDGKRVPVAIKMLKNQDIQPGCEPEILKEARLMRELSHKYIVRMIGLCKAKSIMLVLELAALGPLNSYLKYQRLPQWNIVELMMQVSKGMQYLESKKFVHRDLAARNVLMVSEHFAKISDFGMSKALQMDSNYYEASQAGKWPLKWYAPECVYYWKFDSKSDVWSYGITLWEATSYGQRPYGKMKAQEILQFVVEENQRLPKPEMCDEDVYQVMLLCWMYEKEDRPNFSEISNKMEVLYQKLRSLS
ncbi:hypothetical protein ScPMuIL_000861 [Solemya velum]